VLFSFQNFLETKLCTYHIAIINC